MKSGFIQKIVRLPWGWPDFPVPATLSHDGINSSSKTQAGVFSSIYAIIIQLSEYVLLVTFTNDKNSRQTKYRVFQSKQLYYNLLWQIEICKLDLV